MRVSRLDCFIMGMIFAAVFICVTSKYLLVEKEVNRQGSEFARMVCHALEKEVGNE